MEKRMKSLFVFENVWISKMWYEFYKITNNLTKSRFIAIPKD